MAMVICEESRGSNALVEEWAGKVGRITLDWNAIHTLVFILFHGFTGLSQEVCAELFYAAKDDSLKRNMTLTVAKHYLTEGVNVHSLSDPLSVEKLDLTERVSAAFAKIENLRDFRNRAIHGALTADAHSGVVSFNPFFETSKREDDQTFFAQIEEKYTELQASKVGLVALVNDCAERLGWQKEPLLILF